MIKYKGCNLSPLLFAIFISSLCPLLRSTHLGNPLFGHLFQALKYIVAGFTLYYAAYYLIYLML